MVEVTVANVGSQPDSLIGVGASVTDTKGLTYADDFGAEIWGNFNPEGRTDALSPVNPGSEASYRYYFDLPVNVAPSRFALDMSYTGDKPSFVLALS